MKTQSGFTLIELMCAVGIIGTLASLSIPAYQNYVARAQLAESVQLASAARVIVTEHYALNGTWPETLPEAAVVATARYTSVIGLAVDESLPSAARLTATLRAGGVQRDLRGKTLLFETTDGGKTWSCRADDIEQRLLPQSCHS